MKSLLSFLISIAFLLSTLQGNAQPRYNDVFRIATHNSYWVKRGANFDLFATGTQERLCDQLLFDHVRALEIDIHKIKGKREQWAVYHTTKRKNVFFENFTDFLKQLQQFHYSLPEHEVVTVVLELKEITQHNFDTKHTPAGLDSLLEAYMGASLFRPVDLMKRCPGAENLLSCVQSSKEIWPTIEEMRGKFIFLVLGNFHMYGIGRGGEGWVTYATSKNSSAFPMSSDFSNFNGKKSNSEKIPVELLTQAYNASVFQQVENVGDTNHLNHIAKFIREGGIVRGASCFSLPEQEARIAAGFHMLQTDYPWLAYRDKGYEQPFRAIDSTRFTDASLFTEPGNRIFLSPGQELSIIDTTFNFTNYWETLPSSTRVSPDGNYPNAAKANGKGCLYAEHDTLNLIRVCRKVDKKQNAVITVEIVKNGKQTLKKFKSNKRTSGSAGDYIQLAVTDSSGNFPTVVHVFSSSEMQLNNNGTYTLPKWNLLTTETFNCPLIKQGIMATEGDVLFTGTKRNGMAINKEDMTGKP